MFKFKKSGVIDLTCLISTHAFKYGCKGKLVTLAVYAGFHWASAYEHCRNVHAKSSHHHTRCDLVTVRDADHSVEPVSGYDGLKGIGNDFTAWQGVTHTDMSHGNTVIHTYGVELERYTAGFTDRFFYDLTKFLQVYVTRYNINIRVTNRNKRFIEVLFFNAGCTQQAAVRSTVKAFFNHI
ncbi:hypothetical protein D3C73_265770 [compost metagenome]